MKYQTKLELYSKSPFVSSYENVINFETNEKQVRFFDNSPHLTSIFKSSTFDFRPRSGEVRIGKRFDEVEGATYMRFLNNKKWYYAFVFDVVYINEDTSRIVYEIDMWNTFQHEFKTSKNGARVEQMHLRNRINELSKLPQGMSATPATLNTSTILTGNIQWLVIVGKPEFKYDPSQPNCGSSNVGLPNPFNFHVVPFSYYSGYTVPFEYKGETVEAYLVENLLKYLSGKSEKSEKGDGSNVVNNIVNMYITTNPGFKWEWEQDDKGKITKIKIADNDFLKAHIERSGSGSSGGNSGGGGGAGVLGDDKYPNDTEDHKLRNLVIAIRKNWPNATAAGIAAIAGNFSVESSITPRRYEADFLDNTKYDVMNEKGTIEACWGSWGAFPGLRGVSLNEAAYRGSNGHYCGMGLGQWTGPRGEALFNYAKSHNKSLWATATQIAFAKTESKGGYFGQIATSNGDAGQLAFSFLANWEGIINGTQGQRMAAARGYVSRVQQIIQSEGV